jgi:hypothetical protein
MKVSQNRLLKLYFWLLCFQEVLHVAGVTRVLGIYDPVHIFLAIKFSVDLLFITLYFLGAGSPKVPITLYPFVFLPIYPIFIGLVNQQVNVTFISDIIVFNLFFLKILIFYSIFREEKNRDLFIQFAKNFSLLALFISFSLVIFFQLLNFLGYSFYFSLTPEITYGYALAVTSGKFLLSYLYLISGVLSGKRMLLVGVIVIFFLLYYRYLNKTKHNTFLLIVAIPIAILIAYKLSSVLLGVGKIGSLFQRADLFELSFFDMIRALDNARYNEVAGIIQSMNGIDYVLGKGYGFRYFYLDNIEMKEAGVTHSNAHFSPAGILSKFGFIGVLWWTLFFLFILTRSFLIRKITSVDYANFAFLVSILVQSLFAFILFANAILPMVVGFIMVSRKPHASGVKSQKILSDS